ncbi:hypothetical protein VC83_08737 [Pseudogymnoascus destructans]|uniref:Uncharacterized protein n=2 Tax=Pseudogymnoascus destructans TaxID=655981 RepID=L8GBZ1_PSED2|nr:uncharacterized protein VC83_08737 [Pseudogymnoascus destructans]ELR09561.1 hypothetical protein GMDG_04056 [Pseudogymnoascus destructans 20631-21]OAF55036.1 hypothetical protein VC83_08737 [Pseudogymnoascus destructans]
MPQQYTFDNAAQTTMVGWDPAILRNRTPAQRRTAYLARWGTIAACPLQNTNCLEEQLRRLCWPHKTNGEVRAGTTAKCYGCRTGNQLMPLPQDTPRGLDNEDLLPCGCKWQHTAVELLFYRRALPAATLPPGDAPPNTLTRTHRCVLWEMLQYLQGGNMTVLDLVDGTRRANTTLAAVASGHNI